MGWIDKFVWWLVIIAMCSGNRIFEELSLRSPRLAWNKMGDLMKLCFSDRTNPIIITNDLDNAIYPTSQEIDQPSVYIIDHNYKSRKIQILNPAYVTYILSAESTEKLKALLHELKSSPTWNISSMFFIIGITKHFCENASKMLQVLWMMTLLSSFYVCYESDTEEIMVLYTYNPFNSRAPKQWIQVESIDTPDDRWTLYRQAYSNDKEICDSLLFDKTKVLDGYKVKAVGRSFKKFSRKETYGIDTLYDHLEFYSQFMFFKNLFLVLNATPVINYEKSGYWVNNKAIGYLKHLINGTYDVALNLHSLKYIEYVDFLNMHYQFSSMILTQRINLVTTFENYDNFLNFEIIGFSLLVFFVTFVVIVFNNDYNYGNGFLEIIRLLLSAGISTPLNRLSMRVIFLATTFFIFFMSPALQGQISSLSASPERHYPQNFEDIRDYKFNLYYHDYISAFVNEQRLNIGLDKKYLRLLHDHPSVCYEQVLNDSSNACLAATNRQLQAANKFNLHLAQKKVNKYYVSYWTRKNWVLKSRVDKVVLSFEEMGLFDLWKHYESRNILKKLKAKETMEASAAEYTVEFENLKLVFISMALSFIFCTIVFVVEILIDKNRTSLHRKIIKASKKRVAYVGNRLIRIK